VTWDAHRVIRRGSMEGPDASRHAVRRCTVPGRVSEFGFDQEEGIPVVDVCDIGCEIGRQGRVSGTGIQGCREILGLRVAVEASKSLE